MLLLGVKFVWIIVSEGECKFDNSSIRMSHKFSGDAIK